MILPLLGLRDYCGKYVFLKKSPCLTAKMAVRTRALPGRCIFITTILAKQVKAGVPYKGY
jgi:hypothetical protein